MRLAMLLLVLTAILAAPASARAERRWRVAGPGPNKFYMRSAYANAVYPRYEAGFHARYFQNIGIPSGDVGLRGNSYTLNPW